jgi:hypothetical protein
MKCNKCGSEDIAEILWGMPQFDKELQKLIDAGKIVLGGCCIRGDGLDAVWRCNSCGTDIFDNEKDNIT